MRIAELPNKILYYFLVVNPAFMTSGDWTLKIETFCQISSQETAWIRKPVRLQKQKYHTVGWCYLFIYLAIGQNFVFIGQQRSIETDIFSLLRRQRQMCMLSRLSPFVGVQLWWVLHLEHRRSLQDKFVTWWLIYIVTLICGVDNSCYMIIDTIYLNILSLIMS